MLDLPQRHLGVEFRGSSEHWWLQKEDMNRRRSQAKGETRTGMQTLQQSSVPREFDLEKEISTYIQIGGFAFPQLCWYFSLSMFFHSSLPCWGCSCAWWHLTTTLAPVWKIVLNQTPCQKTRQDFFLAVVTWKKPTGIPGALLVPTHTLQSTLEGNSSVILEKPVL